MGFDWKRPEEVLEKLREETGELEEAMKSGDRGAIEDELGDLLFTAANLARKLDLNPEEVLKKALKKFVDRFEKMEERIRQDGKEMREMDISALESYWQEVK